MFNIKLLAAAIAVSTVTVPALAQEMRCGNLLISGDQIHPLLKEQVLKECGEPTSSSHVTGGASPSSANAVAPRARTTVSASHPRLFERVAISAR